MPEGCGEQDARDFKPFALHQKRAVVEEHERHHEGGKADLEALHRKVRIGSEPASAAPA